MLTSFYIKNYALIDELNVQFSKGLTIITGETGAGKSILLGGLSLVLGKRADLSQIKNTQEKCIIEAVFNISNYNLESLFESLDLDYETETIIRREILPSGKSRAFVNDSPVNLEQLMGLSLYLIDIHSQHQTQQLTQDNYQFKVIDALANNTANLNTFAKHLEEYKTLQKTLKELQTLKVEAVKEYDYNLFLLNELEDAKIGEVDIKNLESEYETLNNVEVIKEKLTYAKAVLNTDEFGVIDKLKNLKQELSKISSFGESYKIIENRINAVNIELDDIVLELDSIQETILTNPEELEQISNKITVIHNLFQKHTVSNTNDLLNIIATLKEKVTSTESLDDDISNTQKKYHEVEAELHKIASKIEGKRAETIPVFISKLESILIDLGMPNARFQIELNTTKDFVYNGKNTLNFLFTANKGLDYTDLKKSASGGELSRIMLAVKSILADYIQLPSIVFDEIDTGVSGEISQKMGDIMTQMSKKMQVFTITHLPQIAAKGKTHYKVYKEDVEDTTYTQLKKLNPNEREYEIAQMLGGINVTESALTHAKQLLN